MAVADWAGTLIDWRAALGELKKHLAPVLGRAEIHEEGDAFGGGARQYSGTAGRIENCQVGVFLGYDSRYGHTLIDRRLYLPKAWTEDSERRVRSLPSAH